MTHAPSRSVSFRIEPFFSIMNELPPLFIEHHKMVKQPFYKDLKIDWPRYLALEQANILHILTARCDEKLVGYLFFNTIPHILYADIPHCFVDIFFLLPEYRKGLVGLRMFKEFEKQVKAHGIKVVYVNSNLSYNRIEKLFKRLGYEPGEMSFIKKVA